MREEHRRLLYVAMTRAEERLIVAGCARQGKGGTGLQQTDAAAVPSTWHDMIRAGFERLGGVAAATTLPGGVKGEVLRFGDADADPPAAQQAALPFALDSAGMAPPPDWLAAAVRGEAKAEPLVPSADPAADDPPAESPLSDERRRRFGRGLVVHKLLQLLPDLPAPARPAAIGRYLEKPGLGLDGRLREDIAAEVSAILDNPEFGALFGPASRAEVPLVGEVGGPSGERSGGPARGARGPGSGGRLQDQPATAARGRGRAGGLWPTDGNLSCPAASDLSGPPSACRVAVDGRTAPDDAGRWLA